MPTTSAVLTGLSLATNIAREATDAVPIVKQVLGVAAHIVTLAEQIDKNREDLRALADGARQMKATIESVTASRELDDDLVRRLVGISGVLRDIELLFRRHVTRGRVLRLINYVLRVQGDVARLKREFDDRLRELQVAASLETNILARGNAPFIGEFRNIRHSEIELLRRLTPPQQDGDMFTVTCHTATCDGSTGVVVVRDIVVSELDDEVQRHLEAHEKILEEMSFIQNRHPAIARLYGRNTGPKHNRFAVLKAGDVRPLRDLLKSGMPAVSVFGRIVAKLADASHHLQTHGAQWAFGLCGNPMDGLYLDERDEPKLGVLADLSTISDTPQPHIFSVSMLLSCILGLSVPSSYSREHQSTPRLLGMESEHAQFIGELIDSGYSTLYGETVVRTEDISNVVPFSPEACMYLSEVPGRWKKPSWGQLLLLRASGSTRWEGSMLRVTYLAAPTEEPDCVKVLCVQDDGETMRHVQITFEIPPSSCNDVRRSAGGLLAAHRKDESRVLYGLEQSAYPGETPTECPGWRRNAFSF